MKISLKTKEFSKKGHFIGTLWNFSETALNQGSHYLSPLYLWIPCNCFYKSLIHWRSKWAMKSSVYTYQKWLLLHHFCNCDQKGIYVKYRMVACIYNCTYVHVQKSRPLEGSSYMCCLHKKATSLFDILRKGLSRQIVSCSNKYSILRKTNRENYGCINQS